MSESSAAPRVAPRYDDPYEEPPTSRVSAADIDVKRHSDILRQRLSVDDSVFDNRGPGDGASTRRDLPPFAIAPQQDADIDSLISSDSTRVSNPHTPVSTPAVSATPLSVPPTRPPPANPSLGNYDEPWDLSSKCRELEERLRSVPNIGWSAPEQPRSHSQSSDDTRPWADGYDRPWDLQPHRRDGRDDAGYDKPWDLKPHEKDVRASVAAVGDYDAPWDIKPRAVVERELIAAKSAKDAVRGGAVTRSATPSTSSAQSGSSEQGAPAQYDEPWDQKKKQLCGKAAADLKDVGKLPVKPRQASAAPTPAAVAEKIDPRLPLDQQSWYHGSISRVDAENLLRVHREGSYLVRTSESNRLDYSLSVKSMKGFMHMKIATETSDNGTVRYILGQFSQPFTSIPQMIYHYTKNKLPVKGAEHMCLVHPVTSVLL